MALDICTCVRVACRERELFVDFTFHDYRVKEYRTNNGAMGVTCIGTNLSTIAKLTYSNVGAWHFKVCGPYVVILLNRHLYVSGIWQGS